MRPIQIAGATHLFKAPANWDESRDGPCHDLAARMELHNAGVDGQKLVTVTVAWMPSAEERRQLAAGALLELTFCSNEMPAHRPNVVPILEPVDVPHGAPAISINEDAHGLGHDEHGPATP
jgi:hypothetical protein